MSVINNQMTSVHERGASVRLSSLMPLPAMVTLAFDGDRFIATAELFRTRLRTLLDIPTTAIRAVRVYRERGIAEFDIVTHPNTVALTFEPAEPSQWVKAFTESGVHVDDEVRGRMTANAQFVRM